MKPSADDHQVAQVCPVLHKPFTDCYCMNISSSSIKKMLAFCIGDHRCCPIYQRQFQDPENPSNTDTRGAMSLTNPAKE
ncbi:MAG TPA: hypothetical protein VJ550_03415 [Geomonas sp.]|nr:hypothetical protein [Geomonas sp.]